MRLWTKAPPELMSISLSQGFYGHEHQGKNLVARGTLESSLGGTKMANMCPENQRLK